ncbi:extracellular solute-binding protein [Cohnella fermenti]|uniref:Extracellular solute-binding protein n=1 Tax=Cohnella fermenti TaxID=2565925 RepID=A0A4S4BFL4_9BACL|nr:extracellular solute-binding protein [Cohnella fermenti]THF73003.1 extracellular solute-binding protein [Cohnella fermenti]
MQANKNKKKTAAVAMATLLAASALLTACSGGNNNEPAASGGADSDASASTSTSASGSAKAKEDRPEITVSVYDRNNVPDGEGTITDNRWTKWINDNAPVKVKFVPVPRSTSQDKFNVLFASGQAPDLIMEYSNPYMKTLASQGQLLPLDDAIAKYSTTYKDILAGDPNLQKLTNFNGKTYFIGRNIGYTTNHYLLIRKDWLDKLQLSMPTTTEEYLQVAKAFAEQDPDGNGKKDTFGTTFTDVDYFFGLGQSTNIAEKNISVTSYFLTADDQYLRSWDQPQAAIQFKKDLYDAGTVDPDIFADKDGSKAQQDWINGKLGIFVGGGLESAGAYNTYASFVQNNPDAEVEILPLPASEFGQFSPAGGVPNIQITAAINASAKNVEAIMQFVDWMMTDDVAATLKYGFEGEHYQIDAASGCPAPIDADKNNKELNWNADFQMLAQTGKMGDCGLFSKQLDASKPLDKAYIDLIDQGRAAYITAERPTTPAILLPVGLPDDLSVTNSTAINTIANLYTKAIVSGAKYSAEQAIADAKAAWTKAGGDKVDAFLAQAYKENEANVIYTEDMYPDAKK